MNSSTSQPTASQPVVHASAPDHTRQAPRSPRVRLGGYAILPRAIDKGRALLVGKNGEYHFGCPLDQQFLRFVGLEADELRTRLAAGHNDGEILDWVQAHARHHKSDVEIEAWVRQQEKRAPEDPDSRAYFDDLKAKIASHRADIASWFELLDVDDYVSFGGRA